MFFKKKTNPNPEEPVQQGKEKDPSLSQPAQEPGPAAENMKQPGIIFKALGSKISSEDLLRRIQEESQEK